MNPYTYTVKIQAESQEAAGDYLAGLLEEAEVNGGDVMPLACQLTEEERPNDA